MIPPLLHGCGSAVYHMRAPSIPGPTGGSPDEKGADASRGFCENAARNPGLFAGAGFYPAITEYSSGRGSTPPSFNIFRGGGSTPPGRPKRRPQQLTPPPFRQGGPQPVNDGPFTTDNPPLPPSTQRSL